MEGKNYFFFEFSRRLKQLDGLIRLTLTHILRQIYATGAAYIYRVSKENYFLFL